VKKVTRKLLLLAAAFSGCLFIGWATNATHLLSIALDYTVGVPNNNDILTFDSNTRMWKAAAGSTVAGSILGQYAAGATSAVTTFNASTGLTGSIVAGVMSVSVGYGTSAGTATQGNDVRHNPAPSGAGKLIYDTGAAYAAIAAGTSTTVLHGGAAPSFSKVLVADVDSGAATSGQVPTSNGAGTVAWASLPASGVLVTNNTSSSTGVTSTAIDFRGTGVTANTSSSTAIATVDVPFNYTPGGRRGGPKIIDPLYIFPQQPQWDTVIAGAPSVAMIILNPNNGPHIPTANISLWQTYSVSVTQAGISGICYVDCAFGATPLATVQADIDLAYYFFPMADGIFLDDCPTSLALQPYVQAIYAYLKQRKSGQKILVINPGTEPNEQYTRCCDIMCSFEGNHTAYQSYSPASWTKNYPSDKFYHIVYGDAPDGTNTAAQMEADMALAQSRNAGWVYFTNITGFTSLPTPTEYWYDEVRQASRGAIRVESDSTIVGLANGVKLAAGSNVTLTPTYDSTNSKATITVASSGGVPVAGTNISVSGSTVSVSPTVASGSLLVGNGTYLIELAKGSASTVLSVSSGSVLGYAQVTNAMIVAAAGIPYSKLTLTSSVVAGDMSPGGAATGTVPTVQSNQTVAYSAPAIMTGINGGSINVTTANLRINGSNGIVITQASSSTTADVTATINGIGNISGGYVDRTGNNLRLLPDRGTKVYCYESSVWKPKTIPSAGITVAGTSLSNSTAYYCYVYDANAGTSAGSESLTLNVTTTVPTTQDGIYVMTGNTARTLLARCYTNASGAITDYLHDATRHLICNLYNKRKIVIHKEPADADGQWTYNSATVRQSDNANSTYQVEFVADGNTLVTAITIGACNNDTTAAGCLGIGLDSTTVRSDYMIFGGAKNASTGGQGIYARYDGVPSTGFHYLAGLEQLSVGGTTLTFLGMLDSGAREQATIMAEVWQ
jgi:hypothetical protein